MEKLKPIIAGILKHRFWILSGVATVICLVGWYLATSKLKSEREQNQSEWESAYSTGEQTNSAGVTATSGTVHPNPKSSKAFEKSIDQLTNSVFEAWQEQYNYQGEDIFVWPKTLGEGFLSVVEPLRPIETKVKYSNDPRDELLSIDYRQTYRDYMQSELPSLAKIIHSKWNVTRPGARQGGFGSRPTVGGGDLASKPDGDDEASQLVVVWDSENQKYVSDIFDWSKSSKKIPSTLEVLYAQEDLWVLTTVMNVIKNTNGDADAPHNAIIKRVHYVYLGRTANTSTDKGSVSDSSASNSNEDAGDEAGDFGGDEDFGAVDGEDEGGGGGGGFSFSYAADPAEGRYVDKNYDPISGEQLRRAGSSTSPSNVSPASVAKRMPIRMKVTIDQRRLNNLLVECGNSPLTIEIRQVRILKSGVDDRASSSNSQGDRDQMVFPYDSQVELFGIVYIYNPVPIEINKSDAEEPASAAAEPAQAPATTSSG